MLVTLIALRLMCSSRKYPYSMASTPGQNVHLVVPHNHVVVSSSHLASSSSQLVVSSSLSQSVVELSRRVVVSSRRVVESSRRKQRTRSLHVACEQALLFGRVK